MEVVKTWEFINDVDGDGIVDDGDTIGFIVSVKNTGNVEITGLTLEDSFIDGGGNLVSFNNGTTLDPRPLSFVNSDENSPEGTLNINETAYYNAEYTVTSAVYSTGLVSNTVTAIGYAQGVEINDVSDDGDDLDGNTENDPTRITMGSNPDVSLIKTQTITDYDGILGAGDIITYSIEISNQGNVPLTWDDSDIIDVMTDGNGNSVNLTTGPDWSYSNKGSAKGIIVDGETAFYTATYVIEQDVVDIGLVQNKVTVTVASPDATLIEKSADGDGDATKDADNDGDNENDPLTLTIPHQQAVDITKTSSEDDGGDGKMDIGDSIDYTIEITNTGNVTLDNVILSDILTDGDGNTTDLTSLLTLSSVNGTPQSILTSLSVGDVATYMLRYTVNEIAMNSGMVSNMATVTASSPTGTNDTTDSTDSAVKNELDQSPLMSLTKSATLNDGGDGKLDIGDTITYTLTLSNTGNVSLTSVSLSDTITDLSGAALGLQSGPTYISGGTSFASTSSMEVGDVIVYEAVFAINQQAINAGGVSNTANASATTPSQGNLTAPSNTVNTPISTTANLEVNKTAAINDNGDGVNGLSDLIEYTITVENTGNIALENLTITDVLTDNKGDALSLVSGPFFAGSTANSIEGKLAVGEVAS
jgi:uncharacterized repeat protein (TIGR01451 family)